MKLRSYLCLGVQRELGEICIYATEFELKPGQLSGGVGSISKSCWRLFSHNMVSLNSMLQQAVTPSTLWDPYKVHG